MTVQELINTLQFMDMNAEVHFAYNYGDHWRTEVAPRISDVREGVVEFSDYHRMDKLVTIEEDYDVYDEDTGETETKVRRVVVLA
jgi:hypothetical protein